MNKDAADRMVDQIMDEIDPDLPGDAIRDMKARIRQVVTNWLGV